MDSNTHYLYFFCFCLRKNKITHYLESKFRVVKKVYLLTIFILVNFAVTAQSLQINAGVNNWNWGLPKPENSTVGNLTNEHHVLSIVGFNFGAEYSFPKLYGFEIGTGVHYIQSGSKYLWEINYSEPPNSSEDHITLSWTTNNIFVPVTVSRSVFEKSDFIIDLGISSFASFTFSENYELEWHYQSFIDNTLTYDYIQKTTEKRNSENAQFSTFDVGASLFTKIFYKNYGMEISYLHGFIDKDKNKEYQVYSRGFRLNLIYKIE